MRGIEEHAFEQRGRGVERRRIAWTQFAVDLDERFFRLAHGIAAQGVGDDVAYVVTVREEDLERGDATLDDLVDFVRGELVVGLEQHFAGGGVDHIGKGHRAIKLRGLNLDRSDFVIAQRLEDAGRDFAAGVGNLFALDHNRMSRLGAQQVGGLSEIFADLPGQLAVVYLDGVGQVEGLENVLVGAQTEGAEKDGAQELALAIDTNVERVLLVVFKLYPGAAIGDDLAQEVGAIAGRLKEDAGRTVQLANNHALGAVDDEGAVLRHQRDVAEEDFLFFNVANGFRARFRVFVVDGEANGHLERRRVGHAALFALCLVILQLETDRVTALVTKVRGVLVVGAALLAKHFAGMERVGDHHGAAIDAGGTEVMESLEVTALALPVADGEVHKVQLGDIAEVGDGENGDKHGLEAVVFPFRRQFIHLQKALIGAALHFDQVRDLDGGWNF